MYNATGDTANATKLRMQVSAAAQGWPLKYCVENGCPMSATTMERYNCQQAAREARLVAHREARKIRQFASYGECSDEGYDSEADAFAEFPSRYSHHNVGYEQSDGESDAGGDEGVEIEGEGANCEVADSE